MVATDITITNGALARLGESSIADFTSNDKSIKCGAIYPTYINTLLAMYPWRFARKKSGALSTAAAPDNAWEFAYTLPADFLRLVNAYDNGNASAHPLTFDYEIFGNTIVSNRDNLYVDYVYTIDECDMPDFFQTFVMTALASILAVIVTDDQPQENKWRQLAFGTPSENGEGGLFKMAKSIDSQQQPSMPFPTQSLISARFS